MIQFLDDALYTSVDGATDLEQVQGLGKKNFNFYQAENLDLPLQFSPFTITVHSIVYFCSPVFAEFIKVLKIALERLRYLLQLL